MAETLGAGTCFGSVLAIDGDRLLVPDGITPIPSRVLELRIGASGIELASTLSPWDGAERDLFGYDIALDGDVAVIGAPSQAGLRREAAYVFRRGPEGWSQEAKLMAEDEGYGWFGREVALEGERLLVSAKAEGSGCVHAFARRSEGWELVDRLRRPDLGPRARFGGALELDSGRIAIAMDPGVAERVFTYRWDETISLEQVLEPPPDARGSGFGTALALSTETLLVSAPGHREGEERLGAVHVYERGADGWRHRATLRGGERWRSFGQGVAVSGRTAVVGARPFGLPEDRVGALVYRRSDQGWELAAQLAPGLPYCEDPWRKAFSFGWPVAVDGSRVVVGECQIFNSPRVWSFQLP